MDHGTAIVTIVTPEDNRHLEQFRDLLLEYEESLPVDLRHGSVGGVDALRSEYRLPSTAFLALARDAPAGCIGVAALDAEATRVQRLYVRPAYRGGGIARKLVNAAVDFSRRHGYRRIVLDTERNALPAAYQLYRSLGFADSEPYGQVDYTCPTFMTLRLR
jgi:GNAT superfamily N-acetyltransferase